jgi:hypothetical protein
MRVEPLRNAAGVPTEGRDSRSAMRAMARLRGAARRCEGERVVARRARRPDALRSGNPGKRSQRPAEIVAQARSSEVNAAKSRGAQELLANAHWILRSGRDRARLLQIGGRRCLRVASCRSQRLVWAASDT